MGAECSRGPSPRPGRRRCCQAAPYLRPALPDDSVGYHSADAPPLRPSSVRAAPLRVAVLGAGTVGREVVRGLLDAPDRLTPADGVPLRLVGVAVRDVEAARARGIPEELLGDA